MPHVKEKCRDKNTQKCIFTYKILTFVRILNKKTQQVFRGEKNPHCYEGYDYSVHGGTNSFLIGSSYLQGTSHICRN